MTKLLLITWTTFFWAGFDSLDKKDSELRENRKSGFEMVFVQGDIFIMGGNDNEHTGQGADECPHKVIISDFTIGKYEVTQADWIDIMGSNPSHFQNCNDCPVEQVSWDDVKIFIQRVNIKYGETYRLPTEDEWEFAARGGIKSKNYKFSGSNKVDEVLFVSTDLCSPASFGVGFTTSRLAACSCASMLCTHGTCTHWIIKLNSRLEFSRAMLGTHKMYKTWLGFSLRCKFYQLKMFCSVGQFCNLKPATSYT